MSSNSTGGSNLWISESIVNDGVIRGIFKTYFVILFIVIGLLGNAALRLWVKRNLLRGKTVLLTQTTGWVHGPPLAKLAFDLRKLPGGWFGWLMILISALDLIGEYGVAITVRSGLQTGTRIFPEGGIIDPTRAILSPNPDWEAFRWATEAQTNNYRNADKTQAGFKHYGIYRMVTNNTNFMATYEDTLGWWSCSPRTGQSIIYDSKWKASDPATDAKEQIEDLDIWTDLWNKGLMYSGHTDFASSNLSTYKNGYSTGPSSHLTIIAASNYTIGELFNISAAIDIHDIDNFGSKEMFVFNCHLECTDADCTVEKIARAIGIQDSLDLWIPRIMGALYPGMRGKSSIAQKDLELTLQYYLNAMIMVSAMNEIVTDPNTAEIPLGIVYRATQIPYWIIVICIVVWLVATFLTSLVIYLFFVTKALALLHDNRNKDGTSVSGREINQNTPVGMLDWMTHAAYESRDAQTIPARSQLKNWILSTTWHAGRRLAIVRLEERGQVNPAKTPGGTSMGDISSPYAQNGYFPSQKGEYVAVQTREVS